MQLMSSVQAPMDHVLTLAKELEAKIPFLKEKTSVLHNLQELTLGSHAWRNDGGPALLTEPASLEGINEAIRRYPHLRHLRVSTSSKDVVGRIAQFSELRSLSVAYVAVGPPCPFEPHARNLLLSSLTHLALLSFDGVCLSTIDKSCPNLQSLTLKSSRVCEENVPPTAFRHLVSLSVDEAIFIRSFRTLLRAARGLVDLCIDGSGICAVFLSGAPFVPYRPHERLRRLTLKTDQRLSQLCRGPEDLHALFKQLSALERLSTDSYDVRLFVQHFHPRIKLTWTSCTICTAEFPKQPRQEGVWRIVHG
ncbi:hypothetical protein HPB48_025355 [Haemaphysalis longicornis]|uniref:Uncharacterized protein n=1 Tax=Haemaphysalis longicornis TaxID=44386 RepID=A0A9J6H999_HAELO|nr:hypothetical protein HPB48_025355 [Haemaphysalis longicornis]